MVITKIYKPFSNLNELEENYKIVIWKNGIQQQIKFTITEEQAKEIKSRLINTFKE